MRKHTKFKDFNFNSTDDVRIAMVKAVHFFYNERPHMSLDNMTPCQAAIYKGKINKKMDQL